MKKQPVQKKLNEFMSNLLKTTKLTWIVLSILILGYYLLGNLEYGKYGETFINAINAPFAAPVLISITLFNFVETLGIKFLFDYLPSGKSVDFSMIGGLIFGILTIFFYYIYANLIAKIIIKTKMAFNKKSQ